MNPITLEYLKFSVAKGFDILAPTFSTLRQAVAREGGVKEQYFGMTDDGKDELVWVLNWPGSTVPPEFEDASNELRAKINALDVNSKPESWFVPFRFAEEVRPALTAPVCEFAFLVLNDINDKPKLAHSLHKTFTDCYFADGFTGGNWGSAINNGRVCLYILGWKSREHHATFARSDLFALEIDRLTPHCGPGSGGWFTKLTKEEY
ncbi:hypothetical protein BDY19DRAFT_942174 [Irpex rosettiformis]|uniref:Uncharacterized protein n=1 Tax=Irpex rosettiformis TaxID=378272 RepID=A0ACB8U4S9_9APHY|nr:hypothetical protein BDY19DRAFT_942174 [Irpex rosettiformis]